MLISTLVEKYTATDLFENCSPGARVLMASLGRVQFHFKKLSVKQLTKQRLADYIKQCEAGGVISSRDAQLDVSTVFTLVTLYTKETAFSVQEVMDVYQPPLARSDLTYARVTVMPDDFGIRFRPVIGANRDINIDWAKQLAADFENVSEQSILVLYPDPRYKDVFRIIDGQHRIYAASKWGPEAGVTFEAQVRSGPGRRVVDQIAKLNLGKRYRTLDHLKNARDESLWPDIFEKYGLQPGFTRSGPKLSWPSVVAGYCMADGTVSVRATSAPVQLAAWRTNDHTALTLVDEAAQILAWWKPACDGASSEHKLYTLQSASGLAFALQLYRENVGKPALKDVPQRILEWPGLPEIRELSAARGSSLAEHLLKGSNYRVKKASILRLGS